MNRHKSLFPHFHSYACKLPMNQILSTMVASNLQLHVAGTCEVLFIWEDSESEGLHVTH